MSPLPCMCLNIQYLPCKSPWFTTLFRRKTRFEYAVSCLQTHGSITVLPRIYLHMLFLSGKTPTTCSFLPVQYLRPAPTHRNVVNMSFPLHYFSQLAISSHNMSWIQHLFFSTCGFSMQNTSSMYTTPKSPSIGGYSHPDGTVIFVDIALSQLHWIEHATFGTSYTRRNSLCFSTSK